MPPTCNNARRVHGKQQLSCEAVLCCAAAITRAAGSNLQHPTPGAPHQRRRRCSLLEAQSLHPLCPPCGHRPHALFRALQGPPPRPDLASRWRRSFNLHTTAHRPAGRLGRRGGQVLVAELDRLLVGPAARRAGRQKARRGKGAMPRAAPGAPLLRAPRSPHTAHLVLRRTPST